MNALRYWHWWAAAFCAVPIWSAVARAYGWKGQIFCLVMWSLSLALRDEARKRAEDYDFLEKVRDRIRRGVDE